MKKVILCFAAIWMCSSLFALPCPFSNFYIDGFGGSNFVNSEQKDNVRVDHNSGFLVGTALGYRFLSFFRLEGEVAYRSNTFDQVVIKSDQGDIQLSASGYIRKVTAMGNILLDIPLFPNDLIAYCGFGIGERWDRKTLELDPVHTSQGTYYFSKMYKRVNGTVFQGILGLTFYAGKNVHTSVGYRYLDGRGMEANHALLLNLKRFF